MRVARVPERSNYYGMDRCHLRDMVTTSDTDNLPEGMVQLVNDMVEGSGKGTNHCGTRVGLIQNCRVRCAIIVQNMVVCSHDDKYALEIWTVSFCAAAPMANRPQRRGCPLRRLITFGASWACSPFEPGMGGGGG